MLAAEMYYMVHFCLPAWSEIQREKTVLSMRRYGGNNQRLALYCLSGDHDNYMSILLIDGCLVIKTRLGSGSFEAEVKPPLNNVRFDDGQWHRVTVTREAREVNTVCRTSPNTVHSLVKYFSSRLAGSKHHRRVLSLKFHAFIPRNQYCRIEEIPRGRA
jgi:hypothetical protein